MKRLYLLTFLSLSILVLSCSHDRASIVLPDKVKDTAKVLTPEPIDFNLPVNVTDLAVWKDSIVIINTNGSDGHKFIEFYNINTHELLKDYFIKGNGPGEMLNCRLNIQNDTIIADDIYRQNFATIPIHDALRANAYTPRLEKYSVSTQFFQPFHNRLLALNPFCFSDKKHNIDNKATRFILTDTSYTYKEVHQYEYDTFNVTPAMFMISYAHNRIFFYSVCLPEIEIYDTDLNLLKKVSGPRLPHNIEYVALGKGITFKNAIPNSYRTHCRNSEYIFLAYTRDFTSGEKRYDELYDTWIFKFDWNGNFIDSYYINISTLSMSLSSDGKSLYVFGRNTDGKDVFHKYRLP